MKNRGTYTGIKNRIEKLQKTQENSCLRTCIDLIHKHELKTKNKMHQRIKKNRNQNLYSNKSNQPKIARKILQGIDDIIGKNMTRQNM